MSSFCKVWAHTRVDPTCAIFWGGVSDHVTIPCGGKRGRGSERGREGDSTFVTGRVIPFNVLNASSRAAQCFKNRVKPNKGTEKGNPVLYEHLIQVNAFHA